MNCPGPSISPSRSPRFSCSLFVDRRELRSHSIPARHIWAARTCSIFTKHSGKCRHRYEGGQKYGPDLKTPQSAQYQRNRLRGGVDELWNEGRSRGVAAQIYLLYLLQECLSGFATLKTRRSAVSKPINMVGEVLTTATCSNSQSNGHSSFHTFWNEF